MFIQRDLRKIPRILEDAAAAAVEEPESYDQFETQEQHPGPPSSKKVKRGQILTDLRLARRSAEFSGSLSILCQPKSVANLQHLTNLSVYDCGIKSLDGIGLLSACPLRVLNVGRNTGICKIPDELSKLRETLEEFWCDDCQIEGPLPSSILELKNLRVLQMSNNKLTSVPDDIDLLFELRNLCLDRNEITQVPESMKSLCQLESLMLRNNKLEVLPDGVPGSTMSRLKMLCISSNRLKTLPQSLSECTSLETLHANSNRLTLIPIGIADHLTKLKRINLSNNQLDFLDSSFWDRFGRPDEITGRCDQDDKCVVYVGQNPLEEQFHGTSTQHPSTSDVGSQEIKAS